MSTPKVRPVSPMVARLDPTIRRESFPTLNFSGFINLGHMNYDSKSAPFMEADQGKLRPTELSFRPMRGVSVASKRRRYDQEVWRNAKRICKLNARQVEMARALGMNPKKLPSLRPSPDQRWKLPVSEFIESCYCKRFGGDPLEHPRLDPESQSSKPTVPKPDLDPSKRSRDKMLQLENLVVYFANLATDLEAWLVHGAVSPNLPVQLIMELKEIVAALETGDSTPSFPGIPLPPEPTRLQSSRQKYRKQEYDDEIPF